MKPYRLFIGIVFTLILGAMPVLTVAQIPDTLPGLQRWKNGVSSYLFGSNDTEEWSKDNVQTDPHHIIQPSMKNAHLPLERTFILHYSLRDGHRTTIGPEANARINLHPSNPHEYDQPVPPANLNTPAGYEVENRIKTVENMGANCLVVLGDIITDDANKTDNDPRHQHIIDPDTGQPETDLDFARKVVAYLGDRCNMYEIGNEPDLDTFLKDHTRIPHLDIVAYVERWTEFVRALRKINPKAYFIGPVTYSPTGNDCWKYPDGVPYPSSRHGDCYMQNFLRGVKGTDVEPDAVSFHLYGNRYCGTELPGEECLTKEPVFYQQKISQIRQTVRDILGRDVPLGITEWGASPGAPKYMNTDPDFARKWTAAILQAMIDSKLDFANQFDTQSYAGWCYLDMFNSCDKTDRPTGVFTAIAGVIKQYRPDRNMP